jgi:archaellum biogenesis ATPase FlaH
MLPPFLLSGDDMTDLGRHLDFLFKEDSGYVYAPIKRPNQEWKQKWFQWPTEKPELTDWIITEGLESDVYLGPVIYKEKKVAKDSIDHSNVVWIEFDGKEDIKWEKLPEPDAIIQTSTSTHLHCFWQMEPLSSDSLEDINRRITYYLEADSSGWDSTQVLRPPNTINYKHNVPVRSVKHTENLHQPKEFDAAPEIAKPVEIYTYEGLVSVKGIKLDPTLSYKVNTEIVKHPHRSEFLMATGYYLAEAGLTGLEIVSCLFEIDNRIKKFVGRQDQLRRLSEIASIALFKVERASYISVYSPKEIITHSVDLEWIIPNLLHTTGMMILSGQPGVGKTQLTFDWTYRLAAGLPVLGLELSRPYRVAFLSLEMDVVELKYIFKHQAVDFKNQGLWNANTFIISPDIDSDMRGFEKTLIKINPDVLVIDSISELATDDLTETESRTIMKWMKKIRKVHNIAIIAIHHNRKASDTNKKPRKLADLYGSFIFAKNSETVASLWHEEGRIGLELDLLKARFSEKRTINLLRTAHLTFDVVTTVKEVISDSRDTGETKPGTITFNFQ